MVGMQADKLPLGEPMLAWTFNRDGEALPGLGEGREKRMSIDSAKLQHKRADFGPLVLPQSGVDDLEGKIPSTTVDFTGIVMRKKAPFSSLGWYADSSMIEGAEHRCGARLVGHYLFSQIAAPLQRHELIRLEQAIKVNPTN